MVSWTIRINGDGDGDGGYVSFGVRVAASETILSEYAIIDFECGAAMWWVLVSEIDLTPSWTSP